MDTYYKKRFTIDKTKPFNPKLAEANTIEISMYYDLGGINYFTGSTKERGIHLSISPLEVGEKWVGYMAFSGTGGCVKPLPRKSEAKGQKVAMLMKEETAKEMAEAFQAGDNETIFRIFSVLKANAVKI